MCPKLQGPSHAYNVNLVRIVSSDDRAARSKGTSVADAKARTWIPPRIWLCTSPLYVGLEVDLTTDSDGKEDDRAFARLLIDQILAFTPHSSLDL